MEKIPDFSALDDGLGLGCCEGAFSVGRELLRFIVHSVLRIIRCSGGIQRRCISFVAHADSFTFEVAGSLFVLWSIEDQINQPQ